MSHNKCLSLRYETEKTYKNTTFYFYTMEGDDFKKICETSKRKSEKLKKIHDKMKRKDCFAYGVIAIRRLDAKSKTKILVPKI